MRYGDSHLQPFRALPSSFRQGHIGCDTAAPLNGGGCGRDRMGAGGGGGCTGRTGGGLGQRHMGLENHKNWKNCLAIFLALK